MAQVAQLATAVAQLATTTFFVLPVSGTICTTSAKDITYIISLALVVQIVPLTGKTKLVVVASCATAVASCATAQTSVTAQSSVRLSP